MYFTNISTRQMEDTRKTVTLKIELSVPIDMQLDDIKDRVDKVVHLHSTKAPDVYLGETTLVV